MKFSLKSIKKLTFLSLFFSVSLLLVVLTSHMYRFSANPIHSWNEMKTFDQYYSTNFRSEYDAADEELKVLFGAYPKWIPKWAATQESHWSLYFNMNKGNLEFEKINKSPFNLEVKSIDYVDFEVKKNKIKDFHLILTEFDGKKIEIKISTIEFDLDPLN
jgi:hypothetical protein